MTCISKDKIAKWLRLMVGTKPGEHIWGLDLRVPLNLAVCCICKPSKQYCIYFGNLTLYNSVHATPLNTLIVNDAKN